jgi:lipid-binding SYLF domain-containing protein
MRQRLLVRSAAVALTILAFTSPLSAGPKQEKKVREARWVYEQLFGNQQRKIPVALLADTRCIAVFPGVINAAFILGGSHGAGVVSCRNEEGFWSPPSFVKISQGSFGFQAGVKASDLVLFFVSEQGAESLLEKRTSFGGTLSAAAGPYSSRAGTTTDVQLNDDVYIYVQSSGLFAGASVEGLRIGTSSKAIRKYYGHYVWPGEILFEHTIPTNPPEADQFREGLDNLPWE